MFLLYTDETNMDPRDTTFFIYGGCSVPWVNAAALSQRIDDLRTRSGYLPLDSLKFNTVERPVCVTPHVHREIKRELMGLAAEFGVKVFISLIHQRVATNPEEARRREINRVCYNFDCFLGRLDDHGIVIVDTFNDDCLPQILREKFSIGLRGLPFCESYRLQRILGFHVATIGSSHFCSVIDVVLGSVRYAVNNFNSADRRAVCLALLQQLRPMLIDSLDGRVSELSIFYSPREIRHRPYLEEYKGLDAFFQEAGINTLYKPGDHAWYRL